MNRRVFIIFLLPLLVICSCKESKTEKAGLPSQEEENYQEISTELELIYDKDQGYRVRLSEMIKNKEPFDVAYVQEMNTSDSINKVRMIEILNQYGWISKDYISDKAFRAIFLVIQHADVSIMEDFYPSFRKLADADSLIRDYAGMMEDRILMYNSKKQIYGTQSSSRQDASGQIEYFIWPIENPAAVNQRRKDAGFETTIQEYSRSMDAIYNPEEILVEFGSR
ncbi:MAG: hypothetical protein ACI9FN_002088 [Saprospiraceae bacterium]|jgi:hypothetical protein